MRYPKRLSRLIVVAVALSLLLSSTVAFAAERTAIVTLNPVGDGSTGVSGQVTVTDSKGPGGETTLSVTLRNTVAGTTYALYLGRMNHDFRVIGLVTWVVDADGGEVTVSDIPMGKAPTNGQSFEVVAFQEGGTAGQVVAISDPIKY